MNSFEKIWEAYLATELRGCPLVAEELEPLRKAFFTGAWCQMKFTRKVLGMRNDVAANLLLNLEAELSAEVEPRGAANEIEPDELQVRSPEPLMALP